MSSNPSTEKVENKLQREWSWKDLYCWLFRDSYKSDVICFIALMLTLLPPKEHIAAGLRQTLKTSMTNVWILISLVLLYLLRCFFFYEINLKIAKKKLFQKMSNSDETSELQNSFFFPKLFLHFFQELAHIR